MASGFFLGGLAKGFESGLSEQSQIQYRQGLLELEQQRLQQQQQNQQRAQYLQLYSTGVEHLGETMSQLRIAHPDWTDMQLASNPAVLAMKNMLGQYGKNLGLPDNIDSVVAGFAARPPEQQTKRAIAVATGEYGKTQADIAEKNARVEYMERGGLPKPGALNAGAAGGAGPNPDAPGLPGNDPALGSRSQASPSDFAPSQDPSVSSVVNAGYIGAKALDFRALMFLSGDTSSVTGVRGKEGQMVRNAIQNRATEIAQQLGMSGTDVVEKKAENKANMAALTKQIGLKNAVEQFEATAVKNFDALIDAAKKVDTTGVPAIESWLRAGKQATGDPAVAAFNFQMVTTRNEIAKILSNPNITGVLTDEAKKEIAGGLQNAASVQQLLAVRNMALGDFGRRSLAIDEQVQKIRDQFGIKKKGNSDSQSLGGITVHGFTFTPSGQ